MVDYIVKLSEKIIIQKNYKINKKKSFMVWDKWTWRKNNMAEKF